MNTEDAFLAPKLLNRKTLQMQVITFNMKDKSMPKGDSTGCGSPLYRVESFIQVLFFRIFE